ncbi:GFA family protein [Paraburkholderia susongensis]|uniref:Uncharacterized conserved protein n=1 Tax=Paraburkholderia susongensis TaxID=1515439 RepID=A0A1X7L7R6_9BURK|nr:GFA family protein [Paraburkholderia susongensis]SMG49765.1 Uncharacterized conserved protein [Paraburkholderia susongensis]
MQRYLASCHCGNVKFAFCTQVDELVMCNCSLCTRRNAMMLTVRRDALQILSGEDSLTLYQWNTHAARHYFCTRCGVYTFHQRRIDPEVYGVNAFCVEGLDVAALPVRKMDGRSR